MTDNLVAGFNIFKHRHYESEMSLMQNLVINGQDPEYFIISCIDSRTLPGMIFQADPGVFFAHTAMGAIVHPHKQGTVLASALQFALEYKNVSKIIVMGHTGCGGVKALAERLDDPEISSFINIEPALLDKARDCSGHHDDHECFLRQVEKFVLLQIFENLKSYPAVARGLDKGTVKILPWMFDMHHGDLLEYDFNVDDFRKINE